MNTDVKTQRVAIGISGLGYAGSGASSVEKALAGIAGVLRAYVNAGTEMAYVEYDPSRLSTDGLVSAVRAAGFEAESPIPLG